MVTSPPSRPASPGSRRFFGSGFENPFPSGFPLTQCGDANPLSQVER